MRRIFLAQMAAIAAGAAAPRVFAQAGSYPDKPIRMIIPFAPAGSVDVIIRIMQPKLTELLGQPIILENRPGGTSSIGASAVTKSAPDGYTLMFTAGNTHVIHTIGASHITYDPLKDFTPVAAVSRSGWALAVHQSVPAKTVAEFVAYCKANPNKISYASAGVGNANHLTMERFNHATGIKTVHVPYKAGAAAFLDLLAGRVQAYFTNTSILQPGLTSGQLRALAYSATRQGEVPPNMTFTAAGLPEFENVDSFNAIMAPPGTPPAIVAKLSAAIDKCLGTPDVRNAFNAQQQFVYQLNAQQLYERLSTDHEKYKQIIKEANIKMEG